MRLSERSLQNPAAVAAAAAIVVLFGVLGLGAVVLVHGGAGVIVILNGLRAARTPRVKS